MPSTAKPFLLSALINNVQSSASIKELLNLYTGPQTADNPNVNIPEIIPILETRMQDIANKHLALESDYKTLRKQWEDITQKANETASLLATIYAELQAADYGTELYNLALAGKTRFEKSTTVLKSVFLQLNNHEFAITHLNIKHYLHTHNRLSDLVKTNEYENDFVKQQLKTIRKELAVYQEAVTWTALRAEIPATLQAFVLLGTNALDKQSLLYFIEKVIKMKALNPLISDSIIQNLTLLQKELADFLAMFAEAINSIYLSDTKQQTVVETIVIYQMVLDLLFHVADTTQ